MAKLTKRTGLKHAASFKVRAERLIPQTHAHLYGPGKVFVGRVYTKSAAFTLLNYAVAGNLIPKADVPRLNAAIQKSHLPQQISPTLAW